MIEYFVRNKEGVIEKTAEYSHGCWINVLNPSDEEIELLIEKFNLKKDNIRDGLDVYEIPRFEKENEETYIYLTVPTEKINQEFASSFVAIYSEKFLITITKYSLELFEEILGSDKRVKEFNNPKNIIRILFSIHRSFEKSIRAIMKETKTSKTDLTKLNNKNIERIIMNEERLNYFISSFETLIKTYNQILTDKDINFSKKDKIFLADLINDLTGDLSLCKNTLKTTSNMRNYYSTKMTNDLNKTVTILTVFTIFLAIPTLISSIYGMNILLPLQSDQNLFLKLGIAVFGMWAVLFSVLKLTKVI